MDRHATCSLASNTTKHSKSDAGEDECEHPGLTNRCAVSYTNFSALLEQGVFARLELYQNPEPRSHLKHPDPDYGSTDEPQDSAARALFGPASLVHLGELMRATTLTKIRANRNNAEKSTGPTSDAGKAQSARNGLKHGIFAKELFLSDEEKPEFEELNNALRSQFKPATPMQEIAFGRVVVPYWRCRLACRLENESRQEVVRPRPGGETVPLNHHRKPGGPHQGGTGRVGASYGLRGDASQNFATKSRRMGSIATKNGRAGSSQPVGTRISTIPCCG